MKKDIEIIGPYVSTVEIDKLCFAAEISFRKIRENDFRTPDIVFNVDITETTTERRLDRFKFTCGVMRVFGSGYKPSPITVHDTENNRAILEDFATKAKRGVRLDQICTPPTCTEILHDLLFNATCWLDSGGDFDQYCLEIPPSDNSVNAYRKVKRAFKLSGKFYAYFSQFWSGEEISKEILRYLDELDR